MRGMVAELASRQWGVEALPRHDQSFLLGHLYGDPPQNPTKKMLFDTRSEARAWLRAWREANRWAFSGKYAGEGGDRIYRDARVVRVDVILKYEAAE